MTWPTGDGASRRRTALVLVALALLLPAVLSALLPLVPGVGGVVSALWGSYLPGAVLSVAAAAAAPAPPGPRIAVVGTGLGGVLLAALFATSAVAVGVGVVGIGLSAMSLAALPALAWLGRTLGGGLHPRLDRAWRTSLYVALALATLLLLSNLVTAITFGALSRGGAGIRGTLLVQQALGGMFTVTGLHLATCAVRSVRALVGVEPGDLRPWMLVAAHGLAVSWAVVSVVTSSAVLTG